MTVPACPWESVYGEAKCQKGVGDRNAQELTGARGVAQGESVCLAWGSSGFKSPALKEKKLLQWAEFSKEKKVNMREGKGGRKEKTQTEEKNHEECWAFAKPVQMLLKAVQSHCAANRSRGSQSSCHGQ